MPKTGVRLLDASGAEVDWDDCPFDIANRQKQPLIDYRYGLRFPDDQTRWHVGSYVQLLSASESISQVIKIFVDDSPRPDYQDLSSRLRETVLQAHEHGAWLREDVLQTLLGISLTLQHHLSDELGMTKVREDLEYAVGTLHDLAGKIRVAARDLIGAQQAADSP